MGVSGWDPGPLAAKVRVRKVPKWIQTRVVHRPPENDPAYGLGLHWERLGVEALRGPRSGGDDDGDSRFWR